MATKRNIVIIGNGIAGTTCARHIRKKCDDKITMVSSETPYFFSRTALMYVYMGHMRKEHLKPYEDWFWKKNRIELVHNHVVKVDTRSRFIEFDNGEILQFDVLVLATGSRTKKYGWPGQELSGVCGLYSMQDLDQIEATTTNTRHAVIVGGGLIGVELAEMLYSRKIPVTMLIREKNYWGNVLPDEEATMIATHIASHGIHLEFQSELAEIIGGNGAVTGIKTSNGRHIDCEFVGISTGVEPNIDFLEESDIETDKGILIDKYFETTVENIYAIGDCAQFIKPIRGRKPVEQVWYTARIHAETLALTLTGNRTAYNPGPWFNSAKFFDIEYQTYGEVKPHIPDEQDSFTWRQPNKEVMIRLVWDKETRELIGVNAFGMRLRHEVFDEWLKNKKSVDHVVDHLAKANFDPEFYKKNEARIKEHFYRQFSTIQI